MKTAKKRRTSVWTWPLWLGIFGMGWLGCDPVYIAQECEDDEDLQTEYNYVDGAICVDGHAACPDGQPICRYLMYRDGFERLGLGCRGPCIECPEQRPGICVLEDKQTQKLSFMCVEAFLDCWEGKRYVEPNVPSKKCPTLGTDCL